MNYEQEQANQELRQLFPKMRPVNSAPSMFTINGVGLSVYGKRDVHPPTGSYIKTHCICVLFIPLIALGAYRVIDAEEGGWYFLGKEPLSGFAKGWNYLLFGGIAALFAIGSLQSYYNSPEAIAGRQISKAMAQHRSGDSKDAVERLSRVHSSYSSKRQDAAEKLAQIHNSMGSMKLKQARLMLPGLLEAQERGEREARLPKLGIKDTFGKVKALVAAKGGKNPKEAIRLLNVVADLAPSPKALQAEKMKLLVTAVKENPNDPEMASELALVYEKQRKSKANFKLLAPLETKLGETEGARILGRIYVRRGKFSKAHGLLLPYTETKLKRLHKAEKRYNQAMKDVREKAIRNLRYGRAPRFFRTRAYRNLPKSERIRRVQQYLRDMSKNDPELRKSRRALVKAAKVVPVAMDLGIVMLYRARRAKSPIARKQELKAAERIFLSIRGVAGKSSRYQLYLGQVYYWMGKPYKGQALFNKVLRKTRRSYPILIRLTHVMRELGEHDRAQDLVEEAYRKAKTKKEKYSAAYLRSITGTGLDDRINWLKKADPESTQVEISLNSARGSKARRNGNARAAARYMRKAIEGYERLPKTSSNLNNQALVRFSLFRATGDAKEFAKGIQLLESALEMKPSDSIMLGNTAYFLLQESLIRTLGSKIDWKSTNQTISVGMLSYLYKNAKQKAPWVEKLSKQPSFEKAVKRYNKMLVLAPKSVNVYTKLSQIYWHTKDEKAMKDLYERLVAGKFNFANPSRYRDSKRNRTADRKARKQSLDALRQQQRQVRKLRYRSRLGYAMAAGTQISLHVADYALGGRVSSSSMLRLAKNAYRRSPSSATDALVTKALLFRAGEALARRDRRFAKMLRMNKRHVTVGYLVTFAAQRDKRIRRQLKRNRDFRTALSLISRSVKDFPNGSHLSDWVLMDAFGSKGADDLAERLKNNKLYKYRFLIRKRLSPESPSQAIQKYFYALLTQGQEGADKIWERHQRWKVPLPSLKNGTTFTGASLLKGSSPGGLGVRGSSRYRDRVRRRLRQNSRKFRRRLERLRRKLQKRSLDLRNKPNNFLGDDGEEDTLIRRRRRTRRRPAPRRNWLE
ncbi:MAG: hypothetical protein EP343_26725 [Deltaproteobacteria bacterium]|nr:MAG: hypothetical protein EP343_26725 [Deltaproteobacteria bacterium]